MKTAGGLIYNDIWGEGNTNQTAILLRGKKKEREKEKAKKKDLKVTSKNKIQLPYN